MKENMVKYKICCSGKLSAVGKLIYCYLIDITDENQECSVAIWKIARQLGLTERTVSGNLHRLEELGYIKIIPQYHVDGGRTVNKYILQ